MVYYYINCCSGLAKSCIGSLKSWLSCTGEGVALHDICILQKWTDVGVRVVMGQVQPQT